jgi:hypothetical protein
MATFEQHTPSPPEESGIGTSEHGGPTTSELGEIVQRLAAEIAHPSLDRSELLQIEITLRGMLPTLEGMLQYAIYGREPCDGVSDAQGAIQTLSQHLQWIQLHAHTSLDRIQLRLTESVHCAKLALQHLSQ